MAQKKSIFTEMFDFKPSAVALVKSGAVDRNFLAIKQTGGHGMTINGETLAAIVDAKTPFDEKIGVAAKAIKGEKGQDAVTAASKLFAALDESERAAAFDAVSGVLGIKAKEKEPDDDDDDDKVLKNLSPEARKEVLDAREEARKAREEVAQERMIRERNEMVMKASKEFSNLPGKPEEIADVLIAAKAFDEGKPKEKQIGAIVEKLLKAADAAMKLAIDGEFGDTARGDAEPGSDADIEAKAIAWSEKAQPKTEGGQPLTDKAAIVTAYLSTPEGRMAYKARRKEG
jgi:hypothetical protein